jgi:carnitine 3-dehydrogenase
VSQATSGSNINLVVTKVAVIGGGVIGGGWVARFLMMGCDVTVFDPDPEAERKIAEVLANARRSFPGLFDHRLPNEGVLSFANSLADAVCDAQWVSECVPERLDLKQKVYQQIQQSCPSTAIIASSTSGFKPSELQQGSSRPQQIIVAHPFNPVYLIPVVELVGHSQTTATAAQVMTQLGMKPLLVRKEIDAHIADRLLEAVWREGLWLINDGVASTQEIDDAITYGFGLRWAQMGLFETYRVAGGEAGMAHFMKQFGPALKWPWTKLMDVPELTDELVKTISDQSDEQSGMYSIRELERIRDDNLVSIMRGLKGQNWGAGRLLKQIDQRLDQTKALDHSQLLTTISRVIPINWTDYNGHLNDSRYAQVFSEAVDSVMHTVGADEPYVKAGMSYFTVDVQITYIDECHAGDAIQVITKVTEGEGKKLRLQHAMFDANEKLLATSEALLIHVDLDTRKACVPLPAVSDCLAELALAHQALPAPQDYRKAP